jgi:GABA(A) receptor-associated protein
MDSKFKKNTSLELRTAEAIRIKNKYPDKLPIIVELFGNCEFTLDKYKYLVPSDLTVGQFMYIIRKKIKLESAKALFMFINNKLSSTNQLMDTIYNTEKDTDGFLYVFISEEQTYG